MARPAAAPRRFRRPAIRGTDEDGGKPLDRGWKKVAEVTLEEVAGWKTVQARGAYWDEAAEVAGNLLEVRLSGGQREAVIRVTGTNNEAVLKAMSADPKQEMVLHLCPDPCPVKAWSDNLMHIQEFQEIDLDALGWGRCLLGHREEEAVTGDELGKLRREAEDLRERGKGRGSGPVVMAEKDPPGEAGGVDPGKEATKEKKKKKKKRKRVRIEGTKELTTIYGNTGLDPDPEIRRRIRKKAREITEKGRNKKRSSSSGSSDSSSSSTGMSLEGDQELFEAPTPVQVVWKKYPGSLTSAMVAEARQSLLVQLGGHATSSTTSVPPLMAQYARQCLTTGMQGPLLRETVHWSILLDLLLAGKIASAADLACQRLKTLEAVCKGVRADVLRAMELVPPEKSSLASTGELWRAGRHASEEVKVFNKVGGKESDKGKYKSKDRDKEKGEKGKEKGKGKKDKKDKKEEFKK